MAETIPPPHDDDRFLLGDLPGWYASSDDVNLRVAIRLLAEERRLREQAEAALLARNIEIDALWKGADAIARRCRELEAKCEAQEIALKGLASGMIEPRVAELEANVKRLRVDLAEAVDLLGRIAKSRPCRCGKPGCPNQEAAAFVAKHKGNQ